MGKILLAILILVGGLVLLVFVIMLTYSGESVVNGLQRRHQEQIIAHFHANEEIFNDLKDYFLDNPDVFLRAATTRRIIEIVHFETREAVNIEEHELINFIGANKLRNIIRSYPDTIRDEVRYSQIRIFESDFVIFSVLLEPIELVYSKNGDIIGSDLRYYPHRREHWINDSWYIQYFYQSRGIFYAR